MIGFRAKRVITLHMKSGTRQRFICADMTITKRGNELTGLETTGGPLPVYVRLDEIEAITHRASLCRFYFYFT